MGTRFWIFRNIGSVSASVLLGLILLVMPAMAPATNPQNSQRAQADYECKPTVPDSMGPFYEPDSPERHSVGEGYFLTGAVKSAKDCSPIPGAKIEFWLAGPDRNYDNDHRATVYAGLDGSYRFQSNFPPGYLSRPPHIHIRVSAQGYRTLVTQHYPEKRDSEGRFDLVLLPE